MPRNPDWFREVGKVLPHFRNGRAFESLFSIRAWHDVQYHAWRVWSSLLYPGYRTHAPYTAAVEYLGFLRRALTFWFKARTCEVRIRDLIDFKKPFYFLPLQLVSDVQIRLYSSFSSMEHVLEKVICLFSMRAPSDATLVIKCHPLDPGMVAYDRIIARLAKRYDIFGRTLYLQKLGIFRLCLTTLRVWSRLTVR